MDISWRRRIILTIPLALAVSAFLAGISILYIRSNRLGLEALSIVATTFLTLGLVVLYRQQYRVLRYQQMPQLDISGFNVVGNFEQIQLDISNVGGGPAASMELRIDLYELSGQGPIQTTHGGLRRIESLDGGEEKKTRSSSIRPSEINISFEAESKGVIGFGSGTHNQSSLATIVANELEKDRNVIYGRVFIEYVDKFSEEKEHEADFSIKFTQPDDLKYELFDFQPWEEEYHNPAFGG